MKISEITPERLQLLRTTLDDMYNLYKLGSDGKPTNEFDYDKCFKTTSYTLGRFYTEINGLIWKERMVLAELEKQQAINKKIALEDTKKEVKFRLENVKEVETWVTGNTTVAEQEEQIKKVKFTIEFLQNSLNQAAYFSGNVKNLLEIRKQQRDFFGA